MMNLFCPVWWRVLFCLGLLVCAGWLRAATPHYEIIYHFGTGGDGAQPQGALVQAKNGDFYGTTYSGGGGKGTVFKLAADGTVTILYRFTGLDDGAHPYGPLVPGPDGNFYGTARGGTDSRDDSGPETVFRVTPAGKFTTLHALAFEEGIEINGLTLGGDGNFYGTTGLGGGDDPEGRGTFFRVTPGGEFTTLHYFTYQNITGTPQQGLTAGPDGCFYGGTYTSSFDNTGTLFKITRDGTVTPLKAGIALTATMTVGSDGALYGQDGGSIFRLGLDGTFATLHIFSEEEGYEPLAPLVPGAGGAFYGATTDGDDFAPTLFRMAMDGTFTTLRTFDGTDGQSAPTALTLGRDGALYAVASQEDDDPKGEISRLAVDGGSDTILHRFAGSQGVVPGRPLARGPDGTLYGVTTSGGAGFRGTLYALSPAGALTTLHAFSNGDTTATDLQELFVTGDGSLCGWTGNTAFQVLPDGSFRVLYSAGRNGGSTLTALTAGPDGSLYGSAGSPFGTGSVFRLGGDGELTVLHTFTQAEGGAASSLVQGDDGRIYGTTRGGGKRDAGTVFALAADSTFTVLHVFKGKSKGSQPVRLIRGGDGALYGVAERGFGSAGEVFQITTAGKFTVLHDFAANGPSTEVPDALVAGEAGRLYGMSSDSFGSGVERLFAVSTTDDAFETVHFFPDADGDGVVSPGGVAYGPDGYLYGVGGGGANGGGVIYRLRLPAVPLVGASVVSAQSVAALPDQDGTPARVQLTLTEPLTKKLVLHYTVGGTATPGTDYTALTGTVKIKPGRTTKIIPVQATGSLGGAAHKTVTLTLTPDDHYDLETSAPLELELVPHG